MNISITNLCNRRCQYCFQKNWYLSDKATFDKSVIEMSVSEYDSILTWADSLSGVKLMGGEPLLHSQIGDFIDVTANHNKTCCLITNLSVDCNKLQFVTNNKHYSCVKALLINSDYPTNQRELFLTNFQYVCGLDQEISVSSTLLPDERLIMQAAMRIRELASIYKATHPDTPFRVRLSPYCPNPNEKFIPFDYSLVLADFLNTIWAEGSFPVGFDCTVLDSEINPQATDAYRSGGITIRKEPCFNRAPFDLLVDGSIIWCSSCNYIKLKSWRDYDCFETAKNTLIQKHLDYYNKHCTKKEEHKINFCMAKELKNEVLSEVSE